MMAAYAWQSLTIGQAGEQEQPLLRPLPEFGYDCSEQITLD